MDETEQAARALEEYMRNENLPNVKYFYGKLENRARFYEIFQKTPLLLAIELANLHIIQLLVEMGADIYETYANELPLEVVKKEIALIESGGTVSDRLGKLKNIVEFLQNSNTKYMNTLNEQGNSPLTQAVQRNSLPAINYLLNEGADLTLKGPDGITPLCTAIISKNMEIIHLLCAKASKLELTNSLLFAIEHKSDWPIVRNLLELGADFTSKYANGKTGLRSALETYGTEFINYLIEKDYMDQVSKTAVESDDLETVRLFIEKHPNILFKEVERVNINTHLVGYFVQAMAKNGIPLDLFFFTSLQNTSILGHFLRDPNSRALNSRNINEVNASGDTLLLLAIEEDNLDMVKFLFELGANLFQTNQNGQTPLDKAVLRNNLAIAEFLLENQAGLAASSALMTAIHEKNLPMVKLLTKHVEDVDYEVKKTAETPLTAALLSGDINIVEALVQKKADLSFSGSKGQTPLELSVELSFNAATKLFIKNNVDSNSYLVKHRAFLLHKFLKDVDMDMVLFLLEHGADVNQLDKNNLCPLVKTVQMKNGNMMNLMLRFGANAFCEHFRETSLLTIAAMKQYLPVVKFLMQNGANVRGAKKELDYFAQQNENLLFYLKKQQLDFSSTNDVEYEDGDNEEASLSDC